MEILTSLRRLYISFKSLVNDFVYSFGRAVLLLLVEVYNHTVPVRERRRIRVNFTDFWNPFFGTSFSLWTYKRNFGADYSFLTLYLNLHIKFVLKCMPLINHCVQLYSLYLINTNNEAATDETLNKSFSLSIGL